MLLETEMPGFEGSIFEIRTTIQEPNFRQPWKTAPVRESGGIGILLENRKILTCAHVVARARDLNVVHPFSHKPYAAHVMRVSHDSEMAILSVDGDDAFSNLVPVVLGDTPRPGTSLVAVRLANAALSTVQGRVLENSVRKYAHSQRELFALTTSLSLAEGSSGAPVFQEGRLVGVAFQSYGEGSALVTDVSPSLWTRRLLECSSETSCETPELGIHWQKTSNRNLRSYLGISNEAGGILVSRVIIGSSVDGILRRGDVILSIDETAVSERAMVESNGALVHFSHLVSRKYIGDTMQLTLCRDRRRVSVVVTLKPYVALVPLPRHTLSPRYIIIAGFVFVPLTFEYIAAEGLYSAHFRLKTWYYDGCPGTDRSEMVLLSEVLPHRMNEGYQNISGVAVEEINGVRITSFGDVAVAFRKPIDGLHVIRISNIGFRNNSYNETATYGELIVFSAEEATTCMPDILATHGVACDRSEMEFP